jgi:hypothetical protein
MTFRTVAGLSEHSWDEDIIPDDTGKLVSLYFSMMNLKMLLVRLLRTARSEDFAIFRVRDKSRKSKI